MEGPGAEDCPRSGVPQSRQNLVAGRLAKPHCGQRGWLGAPHSPQNFVPTGLSEPQAAQRMLLLYPLGRFGARKRRLPNSQAISSCLLVLRGTPSL